MSPYKRHDSDVWQMCFFVKGKKVRRSTKTTNKKIANRIYDKAKIEALEGKFFKNDVQPCCGMGLVNGESDSSALFPKTG